MGLSRNKVAVSEGAAGSPPFYGESGNHLRMMTVFYIDFINDDKAHEPIVLVRTCCSIFSDFAEGGTETEKPGGVAQLGEHLPCKQGVMGSIPIISTKRRKLRPGGENHLDCRSNNGL